MLATSRKRRGAFTLYMEQHQKPSAGRIVHYVLDRGPRQGTHRPAIVVEAVNGYTADLQVFTNGTRGDTPKGDRCPNVFWKPGCVQDEEGKTPGTWHWPERTE